jgi:hypothetical protein
MRLCRSSPATLKSASSLLIFPETFEPIWRERSEARHVRLYHSRLKCPAWKSLSANARAIYVKIDIGARNEALGEHWCLPGSGPLSGRQAADIASRLLGGHVKLRPAGMAMRLYDARPLRRAQIARPARAAAADDLLR